MLPIIWLNHPEFPDFNVEIVQIFYNAYSTPKSFFVEKDFDSWDPKIHGPCNYLDIFYVAVLIDKCGTIKHYPLAMFLNSISKNTRSSVTGKIDNRIPPSSSDSVITSKKKKISVPHLKSKQKNIFYLLKQRMMQCLRLCQKDLPLY